MLVGQDSGNVHEPWQFSVTDNDQEIVPLQDVCSTDDDTKSCDNSDQTGFYQTRSIYTTGPVSGIQHNLKINFVFGTGDATSGSAILDVVHYNFTTGAASFFST